MGVFDKFLDIMKLNDDDYDDDFSDDEDAEERSYVNIDTPAADDAADKKEKAED